MVKAGIIQTTDRKEGVRESLKVLDFNPVKNKDVLIKPNFNTADPTPGSTHNDTLNIQKHRFVYRSFKFNSSM